MTKMLTQTELADKFGLDTISMGKKLCELGLKDKETKLATTFAIEKHLAKNVEYKKGPKQFNVTIWSHDVVDFIHKSNMFTPDEIKLNILLHKLNNVKKSSIRYDDTGSKVVGMEMDYHIDEFKNEMNKSKSNYEILEIFLNTIKEKKLIEYFELGWGNYNEFHKEVLNMKLENQLLKIDGNDKMAKI